MFDRYLNHYFRDDVVIFKNRFFYEHKSKVNLISFFILLLLLPFGVFATEYTSTNFQVLDPVLNTEAGRETSSNFILLESVGQNAIGTSSAASFILKSGFLYFPAPSSSSPSTDTSSPAPVDVSNVPIYILPFIRPLVPHISPEEIEEIVEQLPCANGSIPEDLNCDGNVDLVDVSIFLYLAGDDQKYRTDNHADFNHDGAVTFADLSILFSQWTHTFIPGLEEELSGAYAAIPSPEQPLSSEEEQELFDTFVKGVPNEIHFDKLSERAEKPDQYYASPLKPNDQNAPERKPALTASSHKALPVVGWESVLLAVGLLIVTRIFLKRFGF
ncbi:MAG: hypothetical protein COU90_03615 [Candidatus Ryanbacteria bacterium CG10_big_fil_rev_8_21_14_0_10_43_42]|uniref:Dockerin domain-containing protein n=1 Tax=Candidatus Ryanbacteria bacterium CG10_big_fil_rev_8_21_14_0_10_43_42 TaxID=1974864 RepID=A0A2M8KWG9_9BACT|nr:MAG: hypothetical protein COU90_03615 [Candidatus Ryanbacteria bacterium CG10_big_fil_rev_8_21_14_0_10_43_42]